LQVAVTLLAALRAPRPLPAPEAHSLQRWAGPVVRLIRAHRDPKTLSAWGRSIGVSPGALRNWCGTARLSARRSLLFARVLRAIVRPRDARSAPEAMLDILDRRTLTKVIALSGGRANRLPTSADEFFAGQRLVEGVAAMSYVRAELAKLEISA
jgi:hypothetical protein